MRQGHSETLLARHLESSQSFLPPVFLCLAILPPLPPVPTLSLKVWQRAFSSRMEASVTQGLVLVPLAAETHALH